MISFGLFWLIAVLLLVRWATAPGNGRALPAADPRLEAEVTRLREEVDQLSGQVHRLLDEQAFLLRLLESGTPPGALPGEGEGAARLPRPPLSSDDPPDPKPAH